MTDVLVLGGKMRVIDIKRKQPRNAYEMGYDAGYHNEVFKAHPDFNDDEITDYEIGYLDAQYDNRKV